MSSNQAATPASGASRSALSNDLSFLLARANALSLTAANAALNPLGLKARSYSVLAVAAGGQRPSQRDLAEYLRLDPSQVVALVDDLEARGLVLRETDPSDRRTNVVTATDAGRRLHAIARNAADEAERALYEKLTAAQRAELGDLLRLVAFP